MIVLFLRQKYHVDNNLQYRMAIWTDNGIPWTNASNFNVYVIVVVVVVMLLDIYNLPTCNGTLICFIGFVLYLCCTNNMLHNSTWNFILFC